MNIKFTSFSGKIQKIIR